MIRDQLERQLDALARPALRLSSPDVAAAVETAAEAHPHHAGLRDAVHAVHAWQTAGHGLPPVVGGVLRDRLVRWDDWTSTWEGTDAVSGARAQVRVLRATHQRDPMLRRALIRDGRALRAVLPSLRLDADAGAIVAVMPGPPFQTLPVGGHASTTALIGLLARSLHRLEAWEAAQLGCDVAAPEELCDAGDHVALVRLTPSTEADAGPLLHQIASRIAAWWQDESPEHPFGDLLDALSAVPPRRVAEAALLARQALVSLLTSERHALLLRDRTLRQRDERARLAALLDRLTDYTSPPYGRAAVGVDLDGRTLVVQNLDQVVLWGPVGEAPEVIWTRATGLDVPLARRLLRVRGSAPVSDRLNKEIDGTPSFVDRIARWTAAQIELRTLRLLLEPRLR